MCEIENDRFTRLEINFLIMGRNLRDLREYMGFTTHTLARESGVPRAKILAIERGERPPDVEEMQTLSETMGVDICLIGWGTMGPVPHMMEGKHKRRISPEAQRMFLDYLRRVLLLYNLEEYIRSFRPPETELSMANRIKFNNLCRTMARQGRGYFSTDDAAPVDLPLLPPKKKKKKASPAPDGGEEAEPCTFRFFCSAWTCL